MSGLYQLAEQLVDAAFWYCVDFMVNLANLAHTSYDEANTWVLLLGLPGVLALLLAVRVAQWWQLRKWRRRASGGPTPAPPGP